MFGGHRRRSRPRKLTVFDCGGSISKHGRCDEARSGKWKGVEAESNWINPRRHPAGVGNLEELVQSGHY